MDDKLNAVEAIGVTVTRGGPMVEQAKAEGYFTAECIAADGTVRWRDVAPNIVTNVGKNYALDGYLQTAVTITGPFMGMISSASYGAGPVVGDTMASHAGWTEAGSTNAPTFAARKTTVGSWSAAASGSKALSAAISFAMTGAGTLKGAFLVCSTGAVVTLMDTNGTLYSAGLFTGGDRAVLSSDTVNVSYTASL